MKLAVFGDFVASFGFACGAPPGVQPPVSGDEETGFRDPRRVEILGYTGSAMEPFISCDARHLFFNNRNEPATLTDVLVAERIAEDTFRFLSPVPGLNAPPPTLDGVPSIDVAGNLFFVSSRAYEGTLCTLHSAVWHGEGVSGVGLVPGDFCRRQNGWLTMDAEISRDGSALYYVDARFTGGSMPEVADIGVALRQADGSFRVTPDCRELLGSVNTVALEYAPATSSDGLELFFTRFGGSVPVIQRATRGSAAVPFGSPQPVAALQGFVEAPSISCDGGSLYYHRKDGDEFAIYRAVRGQ